MKPGSATKIRGGVTAVTVLALGLLIGSASAEPIYQGRLADLKVVPYPHLGLSFPGGSPEVYYVMSDAGLGVARLSIGWKYLEPEAGRYSWHGLDARVLELQMLGIEPFLTFESDAPWAVREETRSLTNGTPKDIGTWVRLVRAVVERYDADGRDDVPRLLRPVRFYQVANEWVRAENPGGGWGGTTAELIEFINATYDAVKAQQPDAIFVLGGLSSGVADALVLYDGRADYDLVSRSSAWRRPKIYTPEEIRNDPEIAAIANGRLEPVFDQARYDMADVHLYGPVDRDPVRIAAVRDRSKGRPLVTSECGGPSLSYVDRYRPEDHFMAVVDRNLTILSEGLRFCLWFRLGTAAGSTYANSQTALFDARRRPKPGYYAYKLLAAVSDAAVRVERLPGAHRFLIHRTGRGPLLMAWSDAGENVSLPSGASGDVLKVTDPVAGIYEIAPLANATEVRLDRWPVVIGDLPTAVYQSP